jgi:hypothetical protein
MVPNWDDLQHEADQRLEDNNPSDMSKHDDLTMLRVWLQRNQAGRPNLVDPAAVDEATTFVPMGLWPLVLEKAGNSLSNKAHEDKRPPLDVFF